MDDKYYNKKLSFFMIILLFLANHSIVYATQRNSPFQWSANVALTTDYVFRGLTQTDSGFAIQGGFDVQHKTGFYTGIWASNVKFLEDNTVEPSDRADIEVDIYFGYMGSLTQNLTYDFKVGRYFYPGAQKELNYDSNEFNMTLSYAIRPNTEVGLSYDYSPDFFGGSGKAHHYILILNHLFSNHIGLGAHVGQQLVTDYELTGFDDYIYYGLSLSFPIAEIEATIDYSKTDLDDTTGDLSDDRVFFTLSKSF